jgi:hypothetical protein
MRASASRWRRQRSGQGHGAAIGAEHDAAVNLEPGEAIAWLSCQQGSLPPELHRLLYWWTLMLGLLKSRCETGIQRRVN